MMNPRKRVIPAADSRRVSTTNEHESTSITYFVWLTADRQSKQVEAGIDRGEHGRHGEPPTRLCSRLPLSPTVVALRSGV